MVNVKFSLFVLFAVMLLNSGCSDKSKVTADHHVHLRSDAATEALQTIQEALGEQLPADIPKEVTADDLIVAMDSAGVGHASLLSVGYFFAMPDVEFEDEQTSVREENEYVARQAEKYPDRLVAFCSFNPLSNYAQQELEFCGESELFAGIKLHLANSDVDLRNDEHQKQLAEVFRQANNYDLSVVIHLWTRNPDFGYDDAERFIVTVLPSAQDVPVQIAHLGGPSGFNEATDAASSAFRDAIEEKPQLMEHVYLDIAAVPLPSDQAEGDEELEAQIHKMNRNAEVRIQELGPERILPATDWISGSGEAYYTKFRKLPYSGEINQTLKQNVAPYFE